MAFEFGDDLTAPPDNLFEEDVDLGWLQYYEQPFPPVVRHLLRDIVVNWVKLEYYAHEDPAFAERVLLELRNKANKLPISEVNAIAREEILSFVKTHMDNPSQFLRMVNEYWSKEETESSDPMQSNLVKKLWKACYDLKKRLTYIIQNIATELSTSPSTDLEQEILSYLNELKRVISNTAEIKDFVEQTLEMLRQYQARESDCEKFYVKEMAEWWKSLLLTIENLEWQATEISKHVPSVSSASIDTRILAEAEAHLVAASMIIVESPRLNERTLRVKKKKVTYALQIILPELEEAANLTPALLSEEGFSRHRQLHPIESPSQVDLGATNLYTDEQPVIKDPNSGNYRCVFSELGFDNVIRDRKRARSGSVMFTKLVYMFRTQLAFRGRKIWARCFSMPVVISSHNDQSVQGTAALFWDDYFQMDQRSGLETRTNVSWNEIGSALKNLIFRQTGRRITDLNMRCLRSIFLGKRREEAGLDDDEPRFQMTDLVRPIDGDKLFFWDWLWGTITMLTMKESKFLLNLWRNGYVVGYISQEQAHDVISELLAKEQKHYFLLRFSKRDGKAVVLQGYIEGSDPSKEPLGIFSVLPYKVEHLRETSLQSRIMKRRDCEEIVYQDLNGGWSCERKEKVFQADEQVRRIVAQQLPEGYVGREMNECTERLPKDEAVETEMVVEELDVTKCLY